MRIRDVWEASGIDRVDAEVLVGALFGKDRSWVFAQWEKELSRSEADALRPWIERRRAGEPIAYILRRKEFYGRTFVVDERVLIPRPETEEVVAVALALLDRPRVAESVRTIGNHIACYAHRWSEAPATHTADIGTGSGCIAATLACERPRLLVTATDASDDALRVARENARLHRVQDRIRFRHGPLLEPLQEQREPFLAIANLPYIPSRYALPADVAREPAVALFAGPEGLDLLLPFARQARGHPACIGMVIECREDQIEALRPR